MRARRNSRARWTLLGSVVPMLIVGVGCNEEPDDPTVGQADPVVGKAVQDDTQARTPGQAGQPGMPGDDRARTQPTQTDMPPTGMGQTGMGQTGMGQEGAARDQAVAAGECPRVEDQGLVAALKRELQEDPAVPEGVDVKAQYGVVTLTGTVDDLMAKERAVRLAETMRGVSVVVDDLEVKAREGERAVDDATLRKDVQQALLDDPTADRWKLNVKVNEGRVALGGTVQSWAEKEHAVRVVKGVRGVTAVDDQLTVKLVGQRVDDQVQQDVQARLRWDALIDQDLIDVRVNDGEVKLIGTVRSAAQRRRARADAWVAGAQDVDVSDLQVEPCAVATRRDPSQPAPTDAEIAAAIEVAMALDPMVLSYEVTPAVANGVVTLTGTVDNARARDAAERIANNTTGVTKVDNQIDVRTAKPVDDQALATRVDQALLRNAITESYEIDVAVADGRVTLTGNVDDYSELAEATDVASGIEGVMAVDNQLTVADPRPFIYDPYLLPYHPYGGPGWWHGPITATESDAEIAEEIRDELFWSPFVDRDEVQVTVQDGKATLTGTVDSWQEQRSATENAYEGGAVSVDNQLTVSGYG